MRSVFWLITFFFYKSDLYKLRDRIKNEFDLNKFENEYHNINITIIFLIIGEDHRFKLHIGFDIIAICRAIRNYIFYGRLEGASTIEQQLVRVITKNYDITLKRKLKEIFLATTLSFYIPRRFIPLYYLKTAYFGLDKYGYKNICDHLNWDPLNLTIAQSAGLIARLKYPECNNAITQQKILKRTNYLIYKYGSA